MGQEKGENSVMAYPNSITLVGFVGSDPQQRQAKGNGSKFTVLSIATQRSWKNADDEWSSKTEWHRIVVIGNWEWRQFDAEETTMSEIQLPNSCELAPVKH
jgi:single-strand DNA-binding protein